MQILLILKQILLILKVAPIFLLILKSQLFILELLIVLFLPHYRFPMKWEKMKEQGVIPTYQNIEKVVGMDNKPPGLESRRFTLIIHTIIVAYLALGLCSGPCHHWDQRLGSSDRHGRCRVFPFSSYTNSEDLSVPNR